DHRLGSTTGRLAPGPRSLRRRRARVRVEQVLHVGDLSREDAPADVEQLGDERIAQAIHDGGPAAAALDHALRPEHAELLRGRRRLDVELAQQIANAHLTVAQQLEHTKPLWMAECLEELCLEVVEGLAAVPHGIRAQANAIFTNS